jgi:hypothetical protein
VVFKPEVDALQTFAEDPVAACAPAEVRRNDIHIEWRANPHAQEKLSDNNCTDAVPLYRLHDKAAWVVQENITNTLSSKLSEFNTILDFSWIETAAKIIPNKHGRLTLDNELVKRVGNVESAGSFMVVVPRALGSERVAHLRTEIRKAYFGITPSGAPKTPIKKGDEFDMFFSHSRFVVQSNEIKDSLASSPMMTNCDFIIDSSHLVNQREFIDIFLKITFATLRLRMDENKKLTGKPLKIIFHGTPHGFCPGNPGAMHLLLRTHANLSGDIIESTEEMLLHILCNTKVMWCHCPDKDNETSTQRPAKRAKLTIPSYADLSAEWTAIETALKNTELTILATPDPYLSEAVLNALQTELPTGYRKVYIDRYMKTNRTSRPSLPYANGSALFSAKLANEEFWTNATFLKTALDFPGNDPSMYDENSTLVVSCNRLTLEYSLSDRAQLLSLLGRTRVLIITNATDQKSKFSRQYPGAARVHLPVLNSTNTCWKPYIACEENKRLFGGSSLLLNDDMPGSVEEYIRSLFNALA